MTGPGCPAIHQAVLRRVDLIGLSAGAKVLDAPCGEGELAAMLTQAGYEVSGADIVAGANKVLGQRFRIANLNGTLPWAAETFDLIVCVEGVEHLENPFAFLREAHRLLRPSGWLVVTTPNIISLRSRMRFFASGFYIAAPTPLDESAPRPLHHIGLRTFSEWRYAFSVAGFCLLDVCDCRRKPVSYLYSAFVPWISLYTRLAFRKEKNPAQKKRNREIRRQILSLPLLFSENLLFVLKRI
ncbi:MAG: class I SAM-dependent methyltransferase [Candidatus Acidiferrales bacterium]